MTICSNTDVSTRVDMTQNELGTLLVMVQTILIKPRTLETVAEILQQTGDKNLIKAAAAIRLYCMEARRHKTDGESPSEIGANNGGSKRPSPH